MRSYPLCGWRYEHRFADGQHGLQAAEQLPARFINVRRTELATAGAELAVVGVPPQQDRRPITRGLMMGHRAEDEAVIVGEPFDRSVSEISEVRLLGTEPVKFLSG